MAGDYARAKEMFLEAGKGHVCHYLLASLMLRSACQLHVPYAAHTVTPVQALVRNVPT